MKLSKKALSVLAVLALLGAMLSVIPIAGVSAEDENLVVNGDFANGFTGWTSTMSYDSTAGVYYYPAVGTSSQRYTTANGKLESDKSTSAFVMQKVSVTAGKTYLLKATVAGADASYAGVSIADCVGEDKGVWDTALSNSTYKFLDTNPYGGYVEGQIKFTAASDAVVIGFNNPYGAWANVDDISLVELPPGLATGDFEKVAWDSVNATGIYTQSSAAAHGGTYSMQAASGAASVDPAYCEADGLTVGTPYIFRAWVKGGANDNHGVSLRVLQDDTKTAAELAGVVDGFYDGTVDQTTLDAYTLISCVTGAIAEWFEVVYEFTPTEKNVAIVYYNGSSATAYLDDVTVAEKPAAENLVTNGSFDTDISHWSSPVSGVNAKYSYSSGAMSSTTYNFTPIMQMVPVTKGCRYVLTAKLSSGVAGAGVIVDNNVVNNLGSWASNMPYNATYYKKSTAGGSVTAEIVFTAASNAVLIGFNNNTGAWANVDDFSLVEMEPYPTELVNGDFENANVIDGWTSAKGGTWAATTTAGQFNSGSQAIVHTASSKDYLYQVLEVEPGKTYEITAHMKATSPNAKLGLSVIEGIGIASENGALLAKTYADYVWNKNFDGSNANYDAHNNVSFKELVNYYKTSYHDYSPLTFTITPTQNVIVLSLGSYGGAYVWNFFDDISVELKNDIDTVGAQLHSRVNALRFKYELKAPGMTMNETTHVRGDLSGVKMYLDGVERTITDFGAVLYVKDNPSDADLSVNPPTNSSVKVPAAKLTSLADDGTAVFVARVDVPDSYLDRGVSARAYVEYKDENGATQYYYTDTIVRSINGIKQTLAELENQ